ncbi:DNA ligase [Pieris rapae granulovirus Wuhan]|uniref:DNA ligase n=1 Tax=Pieris rapae granulovirus Wuhan TaxID=2848030 RepID=D2J4R9_9BBAC|nr:DNA ligase [Betabaculovirus arrapae]ACZ63588.1 DNA ligase [Betabaculovirus arrapae]AGS18857.1 DNA ligase [Pieris rapae granulovirus]UOS85774.1 DNA ligase [Pieris rapae granulovirus]
MLFSTFADVYDKLVGLTSINEINSFINKNVTLDNKNGLYMWLYLISTFDKKFKINDKHLLTVFCKIQEPHIDRKNLQEAFKTFGVAQTCSTIVKIDQQESTLTMSDVYTFLKKLQTIPSKSFYLLKLFKSIVPYCNQKALYCIINLIRNTNKNKKLQTKKRNLYLFRQVFGRKGLEEVDVYINNLKRGVNDSDLMIKNINMVEYIKPGKPIESMLAQPCKSFDSITFKEMCIEIKYNGERLQLHKFGDKITCYKRNLNVNQKCNSLTNVIKRVLAHVNNVILDCELVGTCFSDYQLIVFDILYYNGQCLINEKLKTRKSLLKEIMCNEEAQMMNIQYKVSDDKNVVESWVKTILKLDNFNEKDDVEGVVVKNWNGGYEPKRKKWFKIKKSYFRNVCSADLVVVGGWKSENKGGRTTIYLVATPFYDYELKKWMFLPVSKVKYSKNNYEEYMEPYDEQRCDWLVVDEHLKSLEKIPDIIATDPLRMPVWEMEGDFIRSENIWNWGNVTRNYVSIRLPRFIRVRDDKTYKQANTIFDLQLLSSITNKTFQYPELYDFYLYDNIKNYSPNK